MMIENKPGVVRPMRKALKELGRASCRVIAPSIGEECVFSEAVDLVECGRRGRSRRTAGSDVQSGNGDGAPA